MISALDAQKRAFGVEIEGLEQENQAENLKNFCSENNYWDIAELFSISLDSTSRWTPLPSAISFPPLGGFGSFTR